MSETATCGGCGRQVDPTEPRCDGCGYPDGSVMVERHWTCPVPIVTDTTEDGQPLVTFEPWTDGHAVGFKVTRHSDGKAAFIYMNPSTDTWLDGDVQPDVFVYQGPHGSPALDSPTHFYDIEWE